MCAKISVVFLQDSLYDLGLDVEERVADLADQTDILIKSHRTLHEVQIEIERSLRTINEEMTLTQARISGIYIMQIAHISTLGAIFILNVSLMTYISCK